MKFIAHIVPYIVLLIIVSTFDLTEREITILVLTYIFADTYSYITTKNIW